MSLFCSPGAQYEGSAVLGPIVVQEVAEHFVAESHGTLKTDHRAGGKHLVQLAGVS